MSNSGTSLKTYALTRLALVVPMVLILLTLVFLLMRVAPGNPISAALGGHVPASVINQITHQLGFDKPLYVQYGDYLWGIVHGDFGTTITDRRPVSSIIVENGGATLELTVAAGLDRARRRRRPRPAGGPVPRHVDRRRRPDVRDHRLRDAGVLPRLPRAAPLRRLARLAADLEPGEPDHAGLPAGAHAHPLHRRDLGARLGRALGRHAAPDPAGDDARARDRRHLHPARPRERDPHAQGRLRRGGARPRHRRAARSSTGTPSGTRSSR